MKIGACVNAKDSVFDAPKAADYLEPAASAIYNYDEELFLRIKQAVKDGLFRMYSANVLIDSSMRLTGPDVDLAAIRSYCERSFDLLDQLGIKMLVFGSGKAKHVPDGFPMEKAWDQLFELGNLLSDEAKKHGQIIAVEPLSYQDVNIINTVEDAAYYAKAVNRDNFKILVDFYHFHNNGEDFSSIEKHRDLLVHAHFAAPITRMPPRTEEEWAYFKECVALLKRIGYKGGLSFEGRTAPPEEREAMLLRMKEIEKTV